MRTPDVIELLKRFESRNVTFLEADGTWPIVWEKAKGVHVWDARGKKYLDLTAAFGVTAAGHANARVVKAGQRQMASLLHAMGDVHPHALKAQLARALSRITFERWSRQSKKRIEGKTVFCNSGFESVEAALKTAVLATGKPEVIAFRHAYHGLGYGALNVTDRDHYRECLGSQIPRFGHFVPYPTCGAAVDSMEESVRGLFRDRPIGGVVVEPVQGRGGINVPPPSLLPRLRALCDEFGALLIVDEIYTGFGRTGRWFACEHSRVMPDVVCLGKGLTGGFPLSACVGRADLMDRAWPPATGDPIHTSTFLSHPVGCAMALAQIDEITRLRLVTQSARLGRYLCAGLASMNQPRNTLVKSRGIGLLAGLELNETDGSPATDLTFRIVKNMLRRGFILLPDGEHANVITFSPPLIISKPQIRATLEAVNETLSEECG